jgi:hypothetical protein
MLGKGENWMTPGSTAWPKNDFVAISHFGFEDFIAERELSKFVIEFDEVINELI